MGDVLAVVWELRWHLTFLVGVLLLTFNMERRTVTTYYKAVRPDGTDFRTGTVRYDVGTTVTHPNPHKLDASGYLSVSVSAADCTGMQWPCRLMEVESVGESWTPDVTMLPNKRACHELRVLRELDAHEALGPQGAHVTALISRAASMTRDDAERLAAAGAAARAAARAAAGAAAGAAAWDAAWDAAGAAAGAAARAAAGALVTRDLIGTEGYTQRHYDALTRSWCEVVGPVHPDD